MENIVHTPEIGVKTFGDFGIFYQGKKISAPLERSKKLMDMAEYLVTNQNRAVPKDELYELLWPNEESSNPRNALKTLIHRFRMLLVQGGAPDGLEFILVRHGTCQWNPGLDFGVDAFIFDALQNEAAAETDLQRQKELLKQAAALYQGRFLNESEIWMVAPSTYYHSCFLRAVYQLCDLLRSHGTPEEIIEVCRPALLVDELDETINRELILALVAADHVQEANSHYNHITELYYNRLGVQVSEELREVYRHLADNEQAVNLDVDEICNSLEENASTDGAYVCEYSIFRDLYRIEARSLERYGGRMFLALITITDAHLQVPPLSTLGKTMDLLLEVIKHCLRKGDIVARYSPAQYIALLPTVTLETGEQVLQRIRRAYRKQYPKSRVVLSCKLRPLRPLEREGFGSLAPETAPVP